MFVHVQIYLQKAEDLCRQVGQSWRAATLQGYILWHDERYFQGEKNIGEDDMDTDEVDLENELIQEGNWNRDVWKVVISKFKN